MSLSNKFNSLSFEAVKLLFSISTDPITKIAVYVFCFWFKRDKFSKNF